MVNYQEGYKIPTKEHRQLEKTDNLMIYNENATETNARELE